MSHSFRCVALPAERFAALFDKTGLELEAIGARRVVVDEKPGFPCRVSLADADIGETVLLLPFVHHDVESPYHASGPIYVRLGARTATPEAGDVLAMLRSRLLSVRAYDGAGMMRGADIVRGQDLEQAVERLFGRDDVRNLHVHNAGTGCFNCAVVRV